MFERLPAKDKQLVLLPNLDHHGYLMLGEGKRSEEPSDLGKNAMLQWVQRFAVGA